MLRLKLTLVSKKGPKEYWDILTHQACDGAVFQYKSILWKIVLSEHPYQSKFKQHLINLSPLLMYFMLTHWSLGDLKKNLDK